VHVFETGEKAQLRVRNAAGMVSIEAGERTDTQVRLVALRDDDATREAVERATVEQNGGEITVEIGTAMKGFGIGPAWITFGRTPQVGIEIQCPIGSDVDVSTASADVTARGRLGDVEAKSASGDVTVEDVDQLRFHTASGDVRAGNVDREARLQTVSGDIRVGTVRGLFWASVVSGDLTLEEGESDVEAKSVSGDVRIDAVRQGRIKLQSVSGDVRLGVRPGTRLRIDANSVSGDISSEFDVKDRPSDEPTGSEANLQIKTVSGDVELVRAAAVSA
jgi:Putative adhesin